MSILNEKGEIDMLDKSQDDRDTQGKYISRGIRERTLVSLKNSSFPSHLARRLHAAHFCVLNIALQETRRTVTARVTRLVGKHMLVVGKFRAS
jgi:hypothetical protein